MTRELAGGVEAEAGVEEAGVVRAQLAARRVVGRHLGASVGGIDTASSDISR